MKITAIGDIHGRKGWKEIVKNNPGSHFIFLGDYLDSYSNEGIFEDECIENFHDLMEFKKNNNSNVTFLIGNHDFQYLFYPYGGTSGRSKKKLQEHISIFKDNRDYFQFAFQKNNYLFTHAGVSNNWAKEQSKYLFDIGLNKDMSNFGETLNKAGSDVKGRSVLIISSFYRGGGELYGGPLWCDYRELDNNLSGYHQVVGHNRFDDITTFGDDNESITFCDCLFEKNKGYTLYI